MYLWSCLCRGNNSSHHTCHCCTTWPPLLHSVETTQPDVHHNKHVCRSGQDLWVPQCTSMFYCCMLRYSIWFVRESRCDVPWRMLLFTYTCVLLNNWLMETKLTTLPRLSSRVMLLRCTIALFHWEKSCWLQFSIDHIYALALTLTFNSRTISIFSVSVDCGAPSRRFVVL